MAGDLIYSNGVNALTGEYLLDPLEPADVAALAKATPRNDAHERWLASVSNHLTQPSFGVPFDVTADDPASAGWGIVFQSDAPAALQQSLQKLIDHRRSQLGDAKVKILFHQPDEPWADWLARYGVGPGTVDPTRVPYYVLLIGPPTGLTFEMQYLLDVEYAVGRLDFDDVDGYRRYVDGVVDYESSTTTPRDASAAFFGTRHPLDPATQLSADAMVDPLAKAFAPGGRFAASIPGLRVDSSIGAPSTKAALKEILSGGGPAGRPAVLFTATHGIGGWPSGHPDQIGRQGALLCQDWPGVGSIDQAHYFAAPDLPADAQVHGLVAFFFACYGAGTPDVDPYVHRAGEPPMAIAPEPFVAALPKALLSHRQGGALAAIGHVERAWGYTFLSAANQPLLSPFENALGWILLGRPVGYAMKDINERYAVLSASLGAMLQNVGWGITVPDQDLATEWLQRNDAQNYVLLGDPAVRLKPPTTS